MVVKTLLLVDDDPFVRGALTRALNRAGAFAVVPAEHGRHALQLLDTEHVDVMLTDLQMPVMDGLTLLSHLVERGLRLPVAVMTGHSIAPAMRRQLHAYGIAATFTKPVDVSVLADELQRALDPETVGRIRGITLFGLLQLLEVEQKTGLVVVNAGGQEGRLYFESGALVHAHTRGLDGVDAAYEILTWPDPSVEIFYKRRAREHTVKERLQGVLMEAARLLDERGRPGGPSEPVAPPPAAAPARPAPGVDQLPEQALLEEALAIDGALGVALVHATSGMALGHAGGCARGFRLQYRVHCAGGVQRVWRQLHRRDVVVLDRYVLAPGVHRLLRARSVTKGARRRAGAALHDRDPGDGACRHVDR